MNTTTRRHPRTLNDAFSRTADYGCALHVYRRHPLRKALSAVAWIFVLLGIFALTMQG